MLASTLLVSKFKIHLPREAWFKCLLNIFDIHCNFIVQDMFKS